MALSAHPPDGGRRRRTRFAAFVASPSFAQMKEQTVTVGGAPMYPSKNIIQNAVNSKDHTTLVAAVKAAGLVDTLQGPGPVHRVRADQRRVREAAGRHRRHAAQAARKEKLVGS